MKLPARRAIPDAHDVVASRRHNALAAVEKGDVEDAAAMAVVCCRYAEWIWAWTWPTTTVPRTAARIAVVMMAGAASLTESETREAACLAQRSMRAHVRRAPGRFQPSTADPMRRR